MVAENSMRSGTTESPSTKNTLVRSKPTSGQFTYGRRMARATSQGYRLGVDDQPDGPTSNLGRQPELMNVSWV
jgi:hypothetical protein